MLRQAARGLKDLAAVVTREAFGPTLGRLDKRRRVVVVRALTRGVIPQRVTGAPIPRPQLGKHLMAQQSLADRGTLRGVDALGRGVAPTVNHTS